VNRIIQNAVKITEDGLVTYLISSHVHHYNSYEFKDGAFYAVDGGREYIRRGFGGNLDDKNIENYNLDSSSSLEEISQKLLWGTRGKSGKDALTYVPINTLSQQHLKNIIRDNDAGVFVTSISDIHVTVIRSFITNE
jgi:hypothetical protein